MFLYLTDILKSEIFCPHTGHCMRATLHILLHSKHFIMSLKSRVTEKLQLEETSGDSLVQSSVQAEPARTACKGPRPVEF